MAVAYSSIMINDADFATFAAVFSTLFGLLMGALLAGFFFLTEASSSLEREGIGKLNEQGRLIDQLLSSNSISAGKFFNREIGEAQGVFVTFMLFHLPESFDCYMWRRRLKEWEMRQTEISQNEPRPSPLYKFNLNLSSHLVATDQAQQMIEHSKILKRIRNGLLIPWWKAPMTGSILMTLAGIVASFISRMSLGDDLPDNFNAVIGGLMILAFALLFGRLLHFASQLVRPIETELDGIPWYFQPMISLV
jgi:hypothetical protein